MAFGTLSPFDLKVKWKDDWEQVKHEIKLFHNKNGGSVKGDLLKWANTIDISSPIDVVYERGHLFIDDL